MKAAQTIRISARPAPRRALIVNGARRTSPSLSRSAQRPSTTSLRHTHLTPARQLRHNSSLATTQSPSDDDPTILQARRPSNEDAKPSTPMEKYKKLIDKGALRPDDHQTRIIQKLQDLHDQLVDYVPPPIPPPHSGQAAKTASFFSRLFSSTASTSASSTSEPPAESNTPAGLYLYGDVGTGKTMLMDLFYRTLPPNITHKRRVHFHAFMIDVHKRLHAIKSKSKSHHTPSPSLSTHSAATTGGTVGGAYGMGGERGKGRAEGEEDEVMSVARELAQEANVLCFDEFQVTDIADAMILRRLLEGLLQCGVVCVITSNRHPDDLYKNGIQRSSFLPAIALLKSRFQVTDLDSGTDYRRIPRALSSVYHHPLNASTRSEMDKLFHSLSRSSSSTGGALSSGAQEEEEEVRFDRELDIWGRKLHIPKSTSRVAMFEFEELCGKPLSAADYLEVTRAFPVVFVTEVRRMGLGEKDRARRFITFVDACYESKTKLFISSEVPIFQIFSDDSASGEGQISDHQRSVMDDLGLSPETVGSSSMFSGEEEIFAFARCCSRLVQMGSREWAESSGVR